MNQTALNITAITIFTVVMMSLLGPLIHLSPVVPTLLIVSVLGAATIDNLGLEGRGSALVLDWFSRFSAAYRERVVRHEAGHFLMAHLMDIPVTGYTLTAWDAMRQGQSGRGGVSFDCRELDEQLGQDQLSSQLINRFCAVWMAGIAAEQLVYGTAEGGADDYQKLRILWVQLRRSPGECEVKQRWAVLQAKTLIQAHWSAYEALVEAMTQGAPVEDCVRLIQQHQETAAAL